MHLSTNQRVWTSINTVIYLLKRFPTFFTYKGHSEQSHVANSLMTFIQPDLFFEAFKNVTEVNEQGKSTKIEYILCSMKIFQVG